MTLRTLYRHHARLKRLYRSAQGGQRTRALKALQACTAAILKLQVGTA